MTFFMEKRNPVRSASCSGWISY